MAAIKSEKNTSELITSLCRACLRLPKNDEFLDLSLIYDEDEQLSYAECLKILTDIDLTEDKCVPQNFCKECGLELQMAYDFYKKIENSKLNLIEILKEAGLYIEEDEDVEKVNNNNNNNNNNNDATGNDTEDESQVELPIIDAGGMPAVEMVSLDNPDRYEDEGVIEGLEEMEEFQTLEDYEDEDTPRTIQFKIENANNATETFVIEHINEEEIEFIDEKANDDAMSWEQAVVTVANESHLPVKSNDDDGRSMNELFETLADEETTIKVEAQKSHSQFSTEANDIKTTRKRYSGQFSCDYCGKMFPNHSRMALHRRSHEPDRPKFHCEYCGRIYATKQAMESHIRSAHKKTGHQCEICNKVYAIRKGLEIHMRFHTGDFPFVCDICGKKFAQLCHLNTHKNVKHNSVRFSCEHPNCGKFFTSSASLRNHEFTHSVMPFECDYCQKGYPAKAKLKVHIKKKHGRDLTLDELENMRKFHIMRSKLNKIKIDQYED